MYNLEIIEQKIATLLANGLLVSEIAKEINRSKRFILYRLSDLKTSFNCKTNTHLVYTLYESGLLPSKNTH